MAIKRVAVKVVRRKQSSAKRPTRSASAAKACGRKKVCVSIETLKIGLLLAAIDGKCDRNEIRKFKAIASAYSGASDAKISQIITQTQRRVRILEDAARQGAAEDEIVDMFISEAANIGIGADCRNFAVWMSIAMVDGDFSEVERKAIKALQEYVKDRIIYSGRLRKPEVTDIFLKRCEMILAGIYKAEAAACKRMLQNRMKSLQTLIEIEEV